MTGEGSMLSRYCMPSLKELHLTFQGVGCRVTLNPGDSSPAAAANKRRADQYVHLQPGRGHHGALLHRCHPRKHCDDQQPSCSLCRNASVHSTEPCMHPQAHRAAAMLQGLCRSCTAL